MSVTVIPSWRHVETWSFTINKTESSWTLPVVAPVIILAEIFTLTLSLRFHNSSTFTENNKEPTIRSFKSRFGHGRYNLATDTIWLREGLTEKERAEALKHELEHRKFYMKHRALKLFYHRTFKLAYASLLVLAWIFMPLAYLVLLLPSFSGPIHEMQVSLKFTSKLSFLFSVAYIVVMLGLFWMRITL